MNNTPKWNKFCQVHTMLQTVRERTLGEQKRIINEAQADMNKPGKDNTEEILERETDLTTLKEILKPLLDLIEDL